MSWHDITGIVTEKTDDKILQIIKLLKNEFPDTEQNPVKSNPLDVLIATMLSQNTTDKTSYRAYMNLKNEIGSWEDVLNAPLINIRKAIQVCGLAKQKSKNIKTLLKKLKARQGRLTLNYIKKYGNKEIYNELLQYNGIGIKTISCVIAFGLGRDILPVDTHVHRVSNRLGLAKTSSPDKTFEILNRVIPEGKKFFLHTLLIKFGRKICRAKNPFCGKCVLYDLCEYKDKEKYLSDVNTLPGDNNFIILEHIKKAAQY